MPTTFTDRMNIYWTQTLGLAGSKALTEGWQQLEQAADRMKTGATHWQVLQLPTGSGKTEALKILCSIQDLIWHPGVLIVTKFRQVADALAADINRLACWNMARSVHQEAPGHHSDLASTPVLVVTHVAYSRALREVADTGLTNKLDRLQTYICGKRTWLFIDEAFDWADAYSLNLGNLRAMSGDLSGAMQGELRITGERLRALATGLTDIEQRGFADRPLCSEQFGMLSRLDLGSLRNAVADVSDDVFANWLDTDDVSTDSTSKSPKAQKEKYLDLFQQLQTIVRIGHGWVSARGGKTLLHSSRSLIGSDGMRGIVLDATAEIDPTYCLVRPQVQLLPRPQGIRCYGNATLYVSSGHKVGKGHLSKNAAGEWADVWGGLSKQLAGKRTLVCAHKNALPTIKQYGPNNGKVAFANWGNLDGKNDWDTCEAVVLFGLPYLDDIAPALTFTAHQGPQPLEWFGGKRKYEQHTDIRTSLGDGFIARSVVQAINRTQCRKTIDAHGNCAPTDIYILLPNGRTGKAVMRAIQQQMPGIQIKTWHAGASKRKARKVPTELNLTDYFARADPGHYPKSEIARTLRINVSSLERMIPKLRDQSSALALKLQAYGARYHSQTGRGREAYFIKQQGT